MPYWSLPSIQLFKPIIFGNIRVGWLTGQWCIVLLRLHIMITIPALKCHSTAYFWANSRRTSTGPKVASQYIISCTDLKYPDFRLSWYLRSSICKQLWCQWPSLLTHAVATTSALFTAQIFFNTYYGNYGNSACDFPRLILTLSRLLNFRIYLLSSLRSLFVTGRRRNVESYTRGHRQA